MHIGAFRQKIEPIWKKITIVFGPQNEINDSMLAQYAADTQFLHSNTMDNFIVYRDKNYKPR